MIRIAFFASHGGSSAYHIMKMCRDKVLVAEPCLLISNNGHSVALELSREMNVPTAHLSSLTHPDPYDLSQAILATLKAHNADLIVLSGYMKKLSSVVLSEYTGRVLNVHPSLLPKYGGKGMYGNAVHEAVLAAKETITGVTIHLVDEEYDQGLIVTQCKVPVMVDDTIETLRERVLQHEFVLYIETLQKISQGEIKLPITT